MDFFVTRELNETLLLHESVWSKSTSPSDRELMHLLAALANVIMKRKEKLDAQTRWRVEVEGRIGSELITIDVVLDGLEEEYMF